jgi:acyl-coenzyme A thioesterase PaaI-like protein
MHPFDADTAVAAVAESRFAARVTGRWTTPAGTVNGGYLLAMCMQALGQVLPFPDPLAVSAHFLRRAQAGEPAQLVTELLRAGRGHATGEVALGQGGREIVRAGPPFRGTPGLGVPGRYPAAGGPFAMRRFKATFGRACPGELTGEEGPCSGGLTGERPRAGEGLRGG